MLISHSSVATRALKLKLAVEYGAHAVDMEAAAVAKGCEIHGVRFVTVKAISDEVDFAMPPMNGFVNANGQFQTTKFALAAAVRPAWWVPVFALAKNSNKARASLCAALKVYLQEKR